MSFNIMIWNARVVANSNTHNIIKRLIKDHKISVLAIIEPLISPRADFFSRKFGLHFKGLNSNEQIWLFAEQGIEVDEWDDLEQILHARCVSSLLPTPFFISVAYGKCSRVGRIPMWNKLRSLAMKMDGLPWLVGGDFNIFVSEDERQRSSHNRTREMFEFAEAISDCQLLDVGADGPRFTWSRGEIFERLDRVLLGEGWANLFEASRANHPRFLSDHCPLLSSCRLPGLGARPPFHFQKYVGKASHFPG